MPRTDTSAVMIYVRAADKALADGDYHHANAIHAMLTESPLLGAAIGALIVEAAIARTKASRADKTEGRAA